MESASLTSIIGPYYLIIGLSILFYPKQWKEVMIGFSKNHFVMFFGMMISLIVGLIIVNTYNIWEWNMNVAITLTGWGALIKGAFYLLAPGDWTRSILNWQAKWHEGWYYLISVIAIVVGGILTHSSYMM